MNNEMSTEKFEKVKALINKLLAVTIENGATENEAIEATLKVQRLLAKYDMEYADITTTAEDIITEECETSNDLWKNSLAVIVANNFCTKTYLSCNNHVIFYGYKRHCETAREVFIKLYNFGRKRATEIFKEYRNNNYNVKGIKNQFYMGFLDGVKSALEVQSRALMIVTPKEVVEKYNELGLQKKKTRITYNKDKTIYNRGYSAGREVASRKEIEV